MTNPHLIGAERFHELFLRGVPFIDVRSETEFAQGSVPGAVNMPILDTRQREQVGICYKREGQEAAIALGHQLVRGALKAQRIAHWCAFARANPDTHLFCWRGGLRSRLAADWISEAGLGVPVIEGGYKALRNCLLRQLETPALEEPLYVVGGRTGSAKTILIRELAGGVDLEALARHRGSSFGRRAVGPPPQVDFENTLALALLRHRRFTPGRPVFLEDESRQIGAITIPHDLYRSMKQAPLVVVEMPLDFRIERVLAEYVVEDLADYERLDPVDGFNRYRLRLLESLDRIRKRLGGERHADARRLMLSALELQARTGRVDAHRDWIRRLLVEYYDPMYEYQLGKSLDRVVFRGDHDEVKQWCRARTDSAAVNAGAS